MRNPRNIQVHPEQPHNWNRTLDNIIGGSLFIIAILLWVLFYIIPHDRVLDAVMDCTQDGGDWAQCEQAAQDEYGNFLTRL